MPTERGMLTGMFRDRENTENAYNTLQERGYTKDDINVVMSDETRKKHFSGDVKETELGTKSFNRFSKSLHLKVNELIASHEPANNSVIHAEQKTEDEINILSKEYLELVEKIKEIEET